MKRFCRFTVILLGVLALIAGCGGGKKVPPQPAHLTAGMKEISKGIAWYQKGCYRRALGYFLRAHELFVAADQPRGIALSLNNIGNVYRNMGNITDALLFFEESFNLYWDLDDAQSAVQVLSNKAAALIDAERLDEAGAVISQAEGISRKKGITYKPLSHNRAILFIKEKDFKSAETILRRALDTSDSADLSEVAKVNFAYGNLMLDMQHYDEAIPYLEIALKSDRTLGFLKGMADDLAAIATAHQQMERNATAAKFFKRSSQIYALIENREKVQQTRAAFEAAAHKAGIDTRLPIHFIDKWLEGKALESPCG